MLHAPSGAAGCGATLRDYSHWLGDDAAAIRLRDVAAVSFVPLRSGRNVHSGIWAIGIEGGGVRVE